MDNSKIGIDFWTRKILPYILTGAIMHIIASCNYVCPQCLSYEDLETFILYQVRITEFSCLLTLYSREMMAKIMKFAN